MLSASQAEDGFHHGLLGLEWSLERAGLPCARTLRACLHCETILAGVQLRATNGYQHTPGADFR